MSLTCSPKKRNLKKPSIDRILLQRRPIQIHSKISITKKCQNKTKYLSWNSIRFDFVKMTSMSHPVESLGYIMGHSSSSPKPIKSPRNSIRYNCQKICWSRKPETIMEIKTEAKFLEVINKLFVYKFFKDFTNHRK